MGHNKRKDSASQHWHLVGQHIDKPVHAGIAQHVQRQAYWQPSPQTPANATHRGSYGPSKPPPLLL